MAQGDVFSEISQDKTEFSSDIAIIYRIDSVHKQIHLARTSKNYDQYYEWLISLYMELVRIIKEKDEPEITALFENLKKAYFTLRENMKNNKPVSYDLMIPFYAFEERLTRVEQFSGLGFKKYDPRYALANQR